MLTNGNDLDCGLFMSGSTARGRGTRPRGGTAPVCPAARGYQTQAGGAGAFEEAEETRHQGHELLRGALAQACS